MCVVHGVISIGWLHVTAENKCYNFFLLLCYFEAYTGVFFVLTLIFFNTKQVLAMENTASKVDDDIFMTCQVSVFFICVEGGSFVGRKVVRSKTQLVFVTFLCFLTFHSSSKKFQEAKGRKRHKQCFWYYYTPPLTFLLGISPMWHEYTMTEVIHIAIYPTI
jgi:hypothetical protein